MNKFDLDKKNTLAKIDKSRKGEIDEEIKDIIDFINSLPNYYTTSSCSGRILLLEKKSLRKTDSRWIFCSHEKVSFQDIKKALEDIKEHQIWFKTEPAIFHIVARDIDSAQKVVDAAIKSGFKRSGIQMTKKKILVEVGSSVVIDTLIADKGKMIVDDEFLKKIAIEGNKKMDYNGKCIARFFDNLRELN